ncbi:MAG TPA: ATP synthase subunit C [Nitrososphaerales archaeon]|nr:ATP synthase subunit C [Nitrososphaerales archaeon]
MRRLFLVFLSALFLIFLAAAMSAPAAAQGTTTPSNGNKFIAAGIAFGLAALGAGIGVGTSGSAAIAAVTEKAEVRTTALIFVVLAEAIAIYGFAIAFVILGTPG